MRGQPGRRQKSSTNRRRAAGCRSTSGLRPVNLLVDANLSPAVAAQLRNAGHDAVHVIDVGLATALDLRASTTPTPTTLVIVTVHTDFPMLVTLTARPAHRSSCSARQRTRTRPNTPRSSWRTCPPSPTTSNAAPSCPLDRRHPSPKPPTVAATSHNRDLPWRCARPQARIAHSTTLRHSCQVTANVPAPHSTTAAAHAG